MGEAVGLPEGQMGNSEVGHLNLGAGAIVPQDLARIDAAVRDGDARGQRGAANGRWRTPSACTCRPGLRRRRPLEPRPPRGPGRRWPASAACPTWSCTPSPTGATPRRPPEPASWRASTAGRARASAPWSGATSRWTATSAGTARRRPTTCSSSGRGEHEAESRARPPLSAAYERDETDEFVAPDHRRRRGGDPRRATASLAFNFRPDRMRQITRALAERGVRRGRPRGRAGRRAVHDADRVRRGLALSRRLPAPKRPGDHAGEGHRRPRAAPAARRRDREVPARDVLLQRRRGGPVSR